MFRESFSCAFGWHLATSKLPTCIWKKSENMFHFENKSAKTVFFFGQFLRKTSSYPSTGEKLALCSHRSFAGIFAGEKLALCSQKLHFWVFAGRKTRAMFPSLLLLILRREKSSRFDPVTCTFWVFAGQKTRASFPSLLLEGFLMG